MEQERRTTVRNATVEDNTVAKPTVLGRKYATVSHSAVPTNVLKELSTESKQEAAELTRNDTEVLFSVTMLQKIAGCKEEAMAPLQEEALLKTRDYIGQASVSLGEAWKMLTAILDTEADPNLMKKNCLPQAWARHVVTM